MCVTIFNIKMMTSLRVFGILVAFMCFEDITCLEYSDCGSSATIDAVSVEPACPELPCLIYPGRDVAANITFTPKTTHTSASARMAGVFSDDQHYYFYIRGYVCGSVVDCPLEAGVQQIFSLSYSFPPQPNEKFTSKWILKDDNDNTVVCVSYPTQVKHVHSSQLVG